MKTADNLIFFVVYFWANYLPLPPPREHSLFKFNGLLVTNMASKSEQKDILEYL